MYGAIFNSRNLGTGDYQITKIDINMPKNKVAKYELVQADGQVVTSRFFGERMISVKGRIIANDLNEMQSRLDTLKSWTVGYEKPLDISMADTNRRYIATVMNFNYSTQGYYCEFEIDFTCDSLAYDFATTSLSMGTFTSSPTSYTNTIGGTYFTEPNFEFTINQAVPYWSSKYIEFRNSVKNERMRITRSWLPSDKVVIDGKTKTAQIYASTPTVIDNLNSMTGWQSSHTLSLETTNQIEGTGCAKVVMASASTSSYIERLNTTTTIDLSTSSGTVLIPVFIPTPTSGTVTTMRFFISSSADFTTNFIYWDKTTQWNGSAIATNAWNYFAVDLSSTPTSTGGTVTRTAIKSIRVAVRDNSNFQLNGWLVDYLSSYKVSSTPTPVDYEGTFPSLDTGSSTITVTDELTSRNITITGDYYKRWL